MLEQITPLILTYNEAPNIGRTLERLRWAEHVVVVDSGSNDGTQEILSGFPNVRMHTRRFDSHAQQWNFGLLETGIETQWVLAMDADYQLTEPGLEELRGLTPADDLAGYAVHFRYCVNGRPLRGSAYPPVTALYRRREARYEQDGHTQRIVLSGRVGDLVQPMLHDDRKPLSHWVQSQQRYMRLETEKLRAAPLNSLGWADRLRRLRVAAPFVMLFYCLVIRGAIFDGRAGLFYALQRTFAELLLSLYLLETDIFGLPARNRDQWQK